MKKTHRIAVIAGDGIGKEVDARRPARARGRGERFGFDLEFDHFDFASCDYYAKHGQMMPDDWKEQIGGARRDLLRRRRLARQGARPRLAVGLAAPVPARVRPVRQPAARCA